MVGAEGDPAFGEIEELDQPGTIRSGLDALATQYPLIVAEPPPPLPLLARFASPLSRRARPKVALASTDMLGLVSEDLVRYFYALTGAAYDVESTVAVLGLLADAIDEGTD